jgi:uncharacterized protein YheU (UPF0270 family)
MDIPWEALQTDTLRALVEEFVSREGTDYGTRELDFETKVQSVYRLLREKKAKIVFDAETESCDIRECR